LKLPFEEFVKNVAKSITKTPNFHRKSAKSLILIKDGHFLLHPRPLGLTSPLGLKFAPGVKFVL
jgi:deoxyinosine 3'endonuclease (endonuclease V)